MSKILFIVEGEVTEHQVICSLNKVILKEIRAKEIVSYKTNIYKLYERMSSDKDLKIVEILNDKEGLDLNPDDYIAIYLFFDYDGHDSLADDKKIIEMLKYFNNETIEGKLYINYPMIESLKHIKTLDGDDLKDATYEIKKGSSYKDVVAKDGASRYQNITVYTFEIWQDIIKCHLKKLNYILNGKFEVQEQKDLLNINQEKIFAIQKEKYIEGNSEVAVLSSIPIFVGEYIKNKFYSSFLK
ncbi:MAG: hypothetical protein ACRC8M_03000 [Cetobacterium sp.]|uniref:hypothetical protein n=1 Tax=Cetobacterium sp. TaxID=2071632 RepID=UPI003F40ED77